MTQYFENKKNGSLYKMLHLATDCTNARDGTEVVVYEDMATGNRYVREESEFFDKFENVSEKLVWKNLSK
jgi:hypothetical protein